MEFHHENSLHILLSGLFDYAGMFPPANRSFEEALRETASFRVSISRPWMLASDIVLDTEHTHKLRGVNLVVYGARSPFRVCVLATEDPTRVLEEVGYITHKEPPAVVTSIEVKVSPASVAETLEHYGVFCSTHGTLLCLEPNLSLDSWSSDLSATVAALQRSPLRPALKCRLTGPTGISSERFAAAIIAADEAGIPLKVTGGLHHPVVEPERYPFPMGFLNVSVGVMFHRLLRECVPANLLEEILTNQNPEAFTFGSQLGYKDLRMSLADLQKVKSASHFSIGSCSLHEPDEDLTRLFPTW
jgi:hypothetical protein